MRNRYLEVLRTNSQFRRLWAAQLVSQLGDWFSSIALFTLILSLTGSAEAVGLFVGAQFLPAALAGYWTGPLTDRFGRRQLMLIADFGRAGLALCYLFVDRAERIPLIYLITVVMVLFQAVFEPARKSALPDVVSRQEMVLANAISGATWSTMLALGAALGGLVAGLFGAHTAFLLNSLSFLLSAYFVSQLELKTDSLPRVKKAPWSDCFRYLKSQPRIALYACSKTFWSFGGGVSLVLTLYGSNIFPLGVGGALSIGLFYAFRGLGSGLGPFLAYSVRGQSIEALSAALVPGFMLGAFGYLMLSYSWSLPVALGCILLAHIGASVQWVFSTSLLQLSLDSKVRGRVFALEYTGLNLATAVSSYLVGRAGDLGWSAPELAQLMALVLCLSGVCLGVLLWSTAPRKEELAHVDEY